MTMISPPENRGMTVLDRDQFKLNLKTIALCVPAKDVGSIMQDFSKVLLNIPRLRNVVNDKEDNTKKLVLLSMDIKGTELEGMPKEYLERIKAEGWVPLEHEFEIPYSYWTADQVLRSVLPDSTESPTAFEQVGHIAHMNLREQYLEYRYIIGQVILDKSANIETVVNKLETIDNTYRNFKMEVIAGKPDFVATARENGCSFRFDFSKVYWNSRLHSEHERITESFKKGDLVCDAMAGVGPFAIPAAKNKRCTVWANDLNPASYEAMLENIRINKVSKYIKAFNMDARDFIRQSFTDLLNTSTDSDGEDSLPNTFNHVVMNLPGTALEFLDAFRGVYYKNKSRFVPLHDESTVQKLMPMIHVHCFSNAEDKELDIKQRACETMGVPKESHDTLDANVIYVRKVSPKKDMFCLTFRLPQSVAFEDFEPENHQTSEQEERDTEETTTASSKRKEPSTPINQESEQDDNNQDTESSPSSKRNKL